MVSRKLIIFIVCFIQVCFADAKVWPGPEVWPPQTVSWNLNDGKVLTIIATHHTNNLDSPVNKCVKEAFTSDKPDIYVMEGFCGEREGVSPQRLQEKSKICEEENQCGENLYAAHLATINNIKFIGMELSEKAQIPLLKTHGYSRDDVIFYLLVQQLPFFYRDGDFKTHTQKFTPQTWESMCNNFLQETIAGWIEDDVTLTYQDFLQWWKKRFGAPLDMEKEFSVWERGVLYHEPSLDKDALYTQKIAYWFHKNRDDHIFKVIETAVKENTKTLVVFGSNHLRALWDKLNVAYGKPTSQKQLPSAT